LFIRESSTSRLIKNGVNPPYVDQKGAPHQYIPDIRAVDRGAGRIYP
jgi:hypothetical protein